jgi:hypothetical protein
MDLETLRWTLSIQLRYTTHVFQANLAGLSDDDALRQPETGGNCLNWVTGHVVGTRGAMLGLLGQECPFPAERYERYRRGTAPLTGAAGAMPLATMVADFAATAEPLRAGLAALTKNALAAKAPFSPGGREDETVGSLLVGLVFHEAYHNGQLGTLRRLTGAPGALG